MFENDFKLDTDGNSVLVNGEFAITNDDSDFILRMLMSTPGSWAYYPYLGVGLERFIGEQNNQDTIIKIRTAITSFYKQYGWFPISTIVSSGSDSLVLNIEFNMPGTTATFPLTFAFNLENGVINFAPVNSVLVTDTTAVYQSASTQNKYALRRPL